jgi:hypothetical protein
VRGEEGYPDRFFHPSRTCVKYRSAFRVKHGVRWIRARWAYVSGADCFGKFKTADAGHHLLGERPSSGSRSYAR